MKKCTVCREKFPEDEGRIDDDGKFICVDCDQAGPHGEEMECPECGESSEELRTEKVCPHCAAELDEIDEDDADEDDDEKDDDEDEDDEGSKDTKK